MVEQGEYDRLRQKQLIDNSSTASKMANLQDQILETLMRTDISPQEKLLLNSGPEARFAKLQAESNIANGSSVKTDIGEERATEATKPNKQQDKADTVAEKAPVTVRKLEAKDIGLHKAQHAKANALMFKITNRPEIMTSNENGEFVYNGKAIPDSNFEELFTALFKQKANTNHVGMSQFFSGLRQLDISPNEFSSAYAIKAYKARPNTTGPLQNYELAIQKPIATPKPKHKKKSPHLKDQESPGEEFYPKHELQRTPSPSPKMVLRKQKGYGFPPGKRPRILYVY